MTRQANEHGEITIRRVHDMSAGVAAQLADVLVDCVEGGASVSFMHPLSSDRARDFWYRVGDGVPNGSCILLVAEDGDGIVGTVQVVAAGSENQPHRADIAKMLVHRRGRRRGIAEALMRRAETEARAAGKTVLLLDTVTDSAADRLYRRLGWTCAGTVPDYALLPRGGLCSTTFFYRKLG